MNSALLSSGSLSSSQRDLAHGFATHIHTWAQSCHAPSEILPLLYRIALKLSVATMTGHVCLPLRLLADTGSSSTTELAAVSALRNQLFASGVVIPASALDPAQAHPMVITDNDQLYLRRYFDLEGRLAHALARFIHPIHEHFSPAAIVQYAALLDTLFCLHTPSEPDWQKLAVALATQRQLTILSGGPGTGKTTTIAALIACLSAHKTNLRIALTAPTGKAAARMLEALKQHHSILPSSLLHQLRETTGTIHRLLGTTHEPGRFKHHAEYPLALDVLIVDEASMLDLSLATHLIEALPASASLILIGDQNQLAAVEAGAVFSELAQTRSYSPTMAHRLSNLTGIDEKTITAVNPPIVSASSSSPLIDSVVWLEKSYRFKDSSGIAHLAAAINAGEGKQALEWLKTSHDRAVTWIEDDAVALRTDSQKLIEQGYTDYIEALCSEQTTPDEIFTAFDQFRILTPLREGPRGLEALNHYCAHLVRRHLPVRFGRYKNGPWYPGRAIIIQRNAPTLGLYNGDIGLCLTDQRGELVVHFPAAGSQTRVHSFSRLPIHEDAFALTVHKSQGSEFDHILFILPTISSPILSKELLYTGVTRASKHLTLIGSTDHFIAACANTAERHNGLRYRLNEILNNESRVSSLSQSG